MESTNQYIPFPELNFTLAIKREDLLHPLIPGNKFRKLKYNLAQAKEEKQETLLTFGGAFSNHIAAVAAAGKEYGFKTIGVIRGEELAGNYKDNPTLHFAENHGMLLHFVSREAYRKKESAQFLQELEQQLGRFYLLPEGGTNALAVKGCEEILTNEDAEFDYICCAAGTGGTVSGIINSALPHQQVLAFSALKGDFLKEEIRKFARNENWELATSYDFGGYAKIDSQLIGFINTFYKEKAIPLDPVYTAKMVFGVIDLMKKSWFRPGSKILMIHTGGLQGIEGMNKVLQHKNLPLIEVNG